MYFNGKDEINAEDRRHADETSRRVFTLQSAVVYLLDPGRSAKMPYDYLKKEASSISSVDITGINKNIHWNEKRS